MLNAFAPPAHQALYLMKMSNHTNSRSARKALAVLAAATLVVPPGEATAAQLSGQTNSSSIIPGTLIGATATKAITIQKFNPASGQLNFVYLAFAGGFGLTAVSVAEGGVYIPPDYIKSWTWAAYHHARLYGTNFSVLKSSYESDYKRSGEPETYEVTVEVNKSGSFSGDIQIPHGTGTNSAFPQFVGLGTVTFYFDSSLSTAITPLPPTVAGFTWQIATVTSAGIWGDSSQTIGIVYNYTPYPTLQQPVSNSTHTDSLAVQYHLPEAASAGTLKVIFTNANNVDYFLNLSGGLNSAGSHTFTFSPAIAGLPNGPYRVKVAYRTNTAYPDSVSTVATNVNINTRPYTAWKQFALGDANAPDLGDSDNDGIPNVTEYAFNLDPQSSSVLPLKAEIEADPTDGKRYFVVSYPRRISPGTLTYTPQSSSDLVDWAPVPPSNLQQLGAPVPTGDGVTEKVRFRVLPSLDDGASPQLFFRLLIAP